MLKILTMLWGRTTSVLVLIVTGVSALAGLRWKIRANARRELEEKQRGQIIDAHIRAEEAARDVAGLSDDDVDQWMRDKGWIR